MKKYLYFLSFSFLLPFSTAISQAQEVPQAGGNIVESIEKHEPQQGRVRIHQSPEIAQLIGSKRIVGVSKGSYTTNGYRIQIYAGSNSRESKAEAQRIESRVKEYLPDQKVYTVFNAPRWICRVGDFRSIEEADVVMRELKKTGGFKEVSIVREQVTISL